jgi:dienelactone hydrolase
MGEKLQHLGPFSDWLSFAERERPLYAVPGPGSLTVMEVRQILGTVADGVPVDARVEQSWQRDGIAGEEVSWSVGYGPRTHAWLLHPASGPGPWPGVLALHDHGVFKFFGKEKIADGPGGREPLLGDYRSLGYGDRAFANELARRGFSVLVPDVFMWGSRRFPLDVMVNALSAPHLDWIPSAAIGKSMKGELLATLADVEIYNQAAMLHEDIVVKYCGLLGATLAGVVAYEDRVALNYLKSRVDVFEGRTGCIGSSGGGCRAAMLKATSDVDVAVIVCMMSSLRYMLDRHVSCHTWMLFPPGLAARCDWPDLAASRAPSPLMVQYAEEDELFPLNGMRAAHERISAHYESAGAPHSYIGQFYPGGHRFDQEMQDAAFDQLAAWLAA